MSMTNLLLGISSPFPPRSTKTPFLHRSPRGSTSSSDSSRSGSTSHSSLYTSTSPPSPKQHYRKRTHNVPPTPPPTRRPGYYTDDDDDGPPRLWFDTPDGSPADAPSLLSRRRVTNQPTLSRQPTVPHHASTPPTPTRFTRRPLKQLFAPQRSTTNLTSEEGEDSAVQAAARKLWRSASFTRGSPSLRDDVSLHSSLQLPGTPLRRSSSQRSTNSRTLAVDDDRARNRRRKSRSISGMTSVPIGKLTLGGGYSLELDPDPMWDLEALRAKRGADIGMIRADVVDDLDVDWMFAKPAAHTRGQSNSRRKRARAVEDIDPEEDSDFDEAELFTSPPRERDPDGPPTFIDPFSGLRDSSPPPPVPPVPESALARSKSTGTPVVPPRSSKRPTPGKAGVPPLPSSPPAPGQTEIRSTVTALAQPQGRKAGGDGVFGRMFSGSASRPGSSGGVLRKEREREKEFEREFGKHPPMAPPLPTDHDTHVEVIDIGGANGPPGDAMMLLRQLRSL